MAIGSTETPRAGVGAWLVTWFLSAALSCSVARAEPASELTGAGGAGLGAFVVDLTPESWPTLGVASGSGVLVVGVAPDGPADVGGMGPGDIIVAVVGTGVADRRAALAALATAPSGGMVGVVVLRGGFPVEFAVRLGLASGPRQAMAPEALDAAYGRAVFAFENNDPALAVAIVQDLAKLGHGQAQNLLGVFFEMGFGGPADTSAAARWYRLAAEQDVPSAQNNLGLLYWRGDGVPHDHARAYYWLVRTAAFGDPGALTARDQVSAELTAAERSIAETWLAWLGRGSALPTPAQSDELPEPAFEALTAVPDAAPTPVSPGPSADMIRAVQSELSRLGFDPGPADGLAGRRTRAAITAFQEAAKLPRDGSMTADLLAALRAQPSPAPATTPTQPAPSGSGLGDLGFPDADLDIED